MARAQPQTNGEQVVHFVSARKQRGRPKGPMQPPLTPMIDVTFQLLLFFLLTFTFRQAEGQIPGSLPAEAAETSMDVPEKVEIVVRRAVSPGAAQGCEYLLKEGDRLIGKTASPRGLYHELDKHKKSLGEFAAEEVPVILRAGDYVPWQCVVEAFNAAIRAEFKKIGFAGR